MQQPSTKGLTIDDICPVCGPPWRLGHLPRRGYPEQLEIESEGMAEHMHIASKTWKPPDLT